jgi:hypothetical protein
VDKGSNVVPLTEERRENLLGYFEPIFDNIRLPTALMTSDSYFEWRLSTSREATGSTNIRPVFSLRIPKWYNTKMEITEIEISLVLVLYNLSLPGTAERSEVGFTTGLSRKAFTKVLSLSPTKEGPIHPIVLIISLLRYLDTCNDGPIIDIGEKLKDIQKRLQEFQQSREELQHGLEVVEDLENRPRLRKKVAPVLQSFQNAQRNLYNTKFEMRLQGLNKELIALKTDAKSIYSAVEYLVDASDKLSQASDEILEREAGEILRTVYRWRGAFYQRRDEVQKLTANIEDLATEVSCLFLSRLQY